MRFKSSGIPKSQRFAASSRLLKTTFAEFDALSLYRGALMKKFSFDSRCAHRPKLSGPVIASIQVSRELTAIMELYAIAVSEYSENAAEEFESEILLQLKDWLAEQFAKPNTAILGCESIIVEFTEGTHRIHKFKVY